MRPGFARAALAATLLATTPSLVLAQSLGSQMFNSSKPPPPAPKVAPPPALPGATSNREVAPAQRLPTDMEPNDALFDAINRGDIGAARDAISRGADLGGRNILGMTPIELSIDLGRNDISFMLLSMRGADGIRVQQPVAAGLAPTKAAPAKQAKQVPAHAPVTKATAPTPSQNARLFSGDGGTPNPNAGFLGFDSGRR